MPPCHGGGRGFESRPVRKIRQNIKESCYRYDDRIFVFGSNPIFHPIKSPGTNTGHNKSPLAAIEKPAGVFKSISYLDFKINSGN
jgi:hypothetical protein